MKLLRETIRQLKLEDAFDVEGPCVKMLEAMQSSSPDFAMTPDIQITYERSQYTFEYYVAKNCSYKINLNIDSDDAIFIDVCGKGSLHQNTVDAGIFVERGNAILEILLGGVFT